MRGARDSLAVVFVAAMVCAALLIAPCQRPPRPDAEINHLDPDPAVRQNLVRAAARDLVARELIAGRITLPDAAAWFGWLNARPPIAQTRPPGVLAALAGLPADENYGEGEALALQVVAWLGRPGLSDNPARAREAALRQFREARKDRRLLRLPQVAEEEGARLLAQADILVPRIPVIPEAADGCP